MPGPATEGEYAKDEVSSIYAKSAIESYSTAVEKRLKPGLDTACRKRDLAFAQLAELEQMQKALDVLDINAEDAADAKEVGRIEEDASGRPMPVLETRVNIGEEFYMNAHVHSLDCVIVDVGLGMLVELSREEARRFVEERRDMLEKRAERETKRIAETQAILNKVVEQLAELKMATYGADVMGKHTVVADEL